MTNSTYKKKKNNIRICMILFFIFLLFIFCMLIIIDYNNGLSKIGLRVTNFNWNLIGILVDTLTLLLIFILTYLLIDSYNIEKNENKKKIVKKLLKNDYEACLRYLKILSDKKQLVYICNKVDRDKLLWENRVLLEYIDTPFDNEKMIVDYASQGVVDNDLFQNYNRIKNTYKDFFVGIVCFNDIDERINNVFDDWNKRLNEDINKILKKL